MSRLEIERFDAARGIELKLTGELDLETTTVLVDLTGMTERPTFED